jgi:hypothetical protein
MMSSTFTIPPFFIKVDGIKVEIVEVSEQKLVSGDKFYIVSCRVHYDSIESRTFPLFVSDMKDLINKLKVEITKLKIIEYSYGIEHVKKVIT